ncbi:MAG: hypothetical protein EP344_18560 [Bacteroidetes bacterium]|nr:MAG: hypothetical protein EP344_18560 [Bacteroidota bacterium]
MPPHLIWIAYSISNLVALLMLWACWKRPAIGRVLFLLLFAWAAWMNTTTALHTPEGYMEYAQYTFSGWYKQFIQGFFAAHAQPIVLTIATGQALIALGMLTRGPVFKLAAIGAILFLVAIAPLGVGSAFPCTLVMAVAMWQLFRRGSREWLWQAFRQTA